MCHHLQNQASVTAVQAVLAGVSAAGPTGPSEVVHPACWGREESLWHTLPQPARPILLLERALSHSQKRIPGLSGETAQKRHQEAADGQTPAATAAPLPSNVTVIFFRKNSNPRDPASSVTHTAESRILWSQARRTDGELLGCSSLSHLPPAVC
jgi:hypothetical protein